MGEWVNLNYQLTNLPTYQVRISSYGFEQPAPPQGDEAREEADRPRPGVGQRQDRGTRAQGREIAIRLHLQARLRRRPDAAAPARAEARLPQPVPRRVRGDQPRHAGRAV